MKIFQALKSGFYRAACTWKGILITWIVSLILAAMIAVPLKAILRTGFESSMITERFAQGIDIETFTDMGRLFKGFAASSGIGLLFLFLISFITNAFFTGGLFEGVNVSLKTKSFWQACARNFWSFLLIQAVMSFMILFANITIIGIPVIIISFNGVDLEKTILLLILISSILFSFGLPVFLIVADYARVWMVADANTGFFGAIGYGFRQTFRNFGVSWIIMFFLLILQFLYLVLCLLILPGIFPSTGGGVFFLFILSQLLFIGKIFLRVFRYGAVTSLIDLNKGEWLSTGNSPGDGYIAGDHTRDFL